jgi:hypothetical protein
MSGVKILVLNFLKGLRPIFIKREEEKYIKLRDGATARRRMRVWTGPAFAKRSSESTEALEHSKDNNGLALPSSYQARITPHGDLISNTLKNILC